MDLEASVGTTSVGPKGRGGEPLPVPVVSESHLSLVWKPCIVYMCGLLHLCTPSVPKRMSFLLFEKSMHL
jgi:hypothetical protein